MLEPLDQDQARIMLIPDLPEFLQGPEAQCQVECPGAGIAGVGMRGSQGFDLQIFYTLRAAAISAASATSALPVPWR